MTHDINLIALVREHAALSKRVLEKFSGNTRNNSGVLVERFVVPPFSVLDARQGYWQQRKKKWVELGIKSELGRGEDLERGLLDISTQSRDHYRSGKANATVSGSLMPAGSLRGGKTVRGDGRCIPFGTTGTGHLPMKRVPTRDSRAFNCGVGMNKENAWAQEDDIGSGTSIFDPVLCELAYRWFCPPGGSVLDPFAGGSVRGIVAAMLGRSYRGCELRPEQKDANDVQGDEICPDAQHEGRLEWSVGDAAHIRELCPSYSGGYDLLFSCPPYADLERYSDDPRDLSTMPYDSFLRKYRHIVAECCAMLKPDRFAVWVVGDVRNQAVGTEDYGNYRNFPGDTVRAFLDAGMSLYNEAVLVTMGGSLPIRVGYQFAENRKLGKTHQNVMVFAKGSGVRATKACGPVDVDDLQMPDFCGDAAVALCRADVADHPIEELLVSEEHNSEDVAAVGGDLRMAYLLCDALRMRAILEGRPPPRCWLARAGEWRRLKDNECLAYVVGDRVYLSRGLFPDAEVPKATRPSLGRVEGL